MSAKTPLNIRFVQLNSHDSQSLLKTSSKTFLFQLRQPLKKQQSQTQYLNRHSNLQQ